MESRKYYLFSRVFCVARVRSVCPEVQSRSHAASARRPPWPEAFLQPHTCLFIANYPRLTALNPNPNTAKVSGGVLLGGISNITCFSGAAC